MHWASNEDRELWEEEQRRLDREWYAMDEGYDDDNNPFANLSEDYTKKKEEQLEQRRKKRMSAQQRQINKVTCLCSRLVMWVSSRTFLTKLLGAGIFLFYGSYCQNGLACTKM